MGELQAVSEISPFTAIIWCLYPIGILVLAELVLRAVNDDDDDDFQGGKGGGIAQPVYAPSGT